MWLDGRSLSPCHRLNMKSNKEQSCNVQCLCVQKKGAQVVKLMHSWIVTVDAATRTCLCVHEEVSRTVRECTRLPQRHPLHHTIYGEEFQKLGREKSPTVHVKVSSTFRPRGGFPCQDGQPHSWWPPARTTIRSWVNLQPKMLLLSVQLPLLLALRYLQTGKTAGMATLLLLSVCMVCLPIRSWFYLAGNVAFARCLSPHVHTHRARAHVGCAGQRHQFPSRRLTRAIGCLQKYRFPSDRGRSSLFLAGSIAMLRLIHRTCPFDFRLFSGSISIAGQLMIKRSSVNWYYLRPI